MTRIKRGYITRRRRTKMRLFASSFRGAHSRLTRTITQQKIRADRVRKKRDFRHLWIARINAVVRDSKVYYNYSGLMHNLYKKQLLLNRKILAQIAILNRNAIVFIFFLMRLENKKSHRNSENGVPCRMHSGKVE